ncbi:hypothetical protein K432DRAFT_381265 [Lepidopterella palustris CBS 459.81]|uniref:RNA polymerase II transcription factor SIII subunit A n=1 Tax=Lepidopterella palustris CBS 459.81 TaxID=1314670 RepID=A0A8E2JGD2_9PEZI|nr:hypothetical protein K432DRAFT_381265 [Lepidopterella palustris CBS 459.81]
MPVPTLFELAKHRIIQNIEMLTDVGDLPYEFLRPILLKVENPTQLREIEVNSPQIAGEDGEIWLRYIKRDFQNWDKKPHQPKEPTSWWKVYRFLKNEAEKEKKEQEDKLKESLRALQADKDAKTSIIVNAPIGFDPAKRRRTPGHSGFGSSSGAPPKNSKSTLDRFKRSIYDQKVARPKMSLMPAHLLEERKGRVIAAPKSMMRNPSMTVPPKGSYAQSARSTTSSTKGATSTNTLKIDDSVLDDSKLDEGALDGNTLAAREKRLKAITNPGSETPTPARTKTSLPADKTFKAPQLGASTSSNPTLTPQKRKREAKVTNIFMPKKQRKA